MPVIQAKSAGFCYGVRRAVELAEKTARENGGCVMLGSIIHNANVVARLERLGARQADTPDQVCPGDTVIIRSHGETKQVLEGGRSRAHSPGHRGAPPPGGHGRGQLVGPDSGVFRAGGTGAVAAGGPRPAESALDGSGPDHLRAEYLGKFKKNSKKTVYKRGII